METEIQIWIDEVYQNSNAGDMFCDEDWNSMAIGFALGHGYSVDEAYSFALELSRRGKI